MEVNGEDIGVTPLTKEDIDPASMTSVVLKADGYQDLTQELAWPAEGEPVLDLEVALEKETKKTQGKTKHTKSAAKEEKAAEAPKAVEPPKEEPKPEKTKPAKTEKPAKAAPEPKTPPKKDEPKPAPAAPAAPKAGMGKLMAVTKPAGAEVAIDGESTHKKTPIAGAKAIPISAGDHVVVFTLPDGRTAIRSISVSANQTVKLTGVDDFN